MFVLCVYVRVWVLLFPLYVGCAFCKCVCVCCVFVHVCLCVCVCGVLVYSCMIVCAVSSGLAWCVARGVWRV